MSEKKIIFSLITIGISSVVTQLVLLREAISTFSGNELVIGVFLGIWLMANALGAFLGSRYTHKKKQSKHLFFWGHLTLAILPFLQLAGFRGLPFLWIRGELLGIGSVIFGSSLILLPSCIIFGALIPVGSCFFKNPDEAPSLAFITEVAGDILGGLLFSFLFVYIFSHWQILMAIGFLNLFMAILISSFKLWPLPISLFAVIIISTPLNLFTLSWRTPGQKILLHKNTPFAQLTITQSQNQLNVLSNGLALFSSQDYRAEALAHIPLSQVRQGAKVLLISGGVLGTLHEMLKHQLGGIDYVELDPDILSLDDKIRKVLPHSLIRTHIGDGRIFIKEAAKKGLLYDCLIIDVPDPENIQLNRFYTLDFFQEAKRILAPDGLLFFTLTGADNYLEEEGLALNRSVYAALGKEFSNILLLPGETHYFLAADRPFLDIDDELRKKKIPITWLLDYQLPEISDPFRIDDLKNLISQEESFPNKDLSPRAFQHLLNLWMKKSRSPKWLIPLIFFSLAIFFLLVFLFYKVPFITLSSGYAGISLELSLIILFQIIFGYLYLWICVFITLFMIGALIGALSAKKWATTAISHLILPDTGFILLSLGILFLAFFYKTLQHAFSLILIHYGLIPLLIFISAVMVGWQFVAIARRYTHQSERSSAKITGSLYLADLAGASFGTFFISLFLLPKFGLMGILLSVIIVKCISLIILCKHSI